MSANGDHLTSLRVGLSSFRSALILWLLATIVEAFLYQTFRSVIMESIEGASYLSVLLKYLLFRVSYSMIPVLVGAALIGGSKPERRWSYIIMTIASLQAPAILSFTETVLFDPSIMGWCIASYALLYVLNPQVRRSTSNP
jgi:hypothetical protein